MFKFITTRYLSDRVSPTASLLYVNRLIQRVTDGLLGLFLPIFLYERFESINLVVIFFILNYLIYIFAAPLGAIIASKVNFKNAMIISIAGGVVYFLAFYFFDIAPYLMSVIAILAVNLCRMLYWTPYFSGFAVATNKKNRGRVVALFSSFDSLLMIVLPAVAGFVITFNGFGTLFLISAAIFMVSVIPLLAMPPIYEFYNFSYLQTWRILFHPRDLRIFLTYFGSGAENMATIVIWPIFIWQIMNGNYESVGLLTSLIILVTIIFRLILGRLVDSFDKKKMVRYGTVLYSFGWFLKVFAQTGFQVFITSAYHGFALVAMRAPFDTLIYERAADSGRYVDEYTVLREMAASIGRVAMLLLFLLILSFFGISYAFILAGLAVLLMNFI